MSRLHLNHLFHPRSVAVVGASVKPHAVGHVVLKNLLQGGFTGTILPVNPHHDVIENTKTYPTVAALPDPPELAVIATPAPTVPDLIRQLGERGTCVAVVLSAGFRSASEQHVAPQALLDAAKPNGLRILGPNSIGLLIPEIGLNASFAHVGAVPGRLAFVSQSGALCTTILDWARSKGIGFSHFLSLGDCIDIDFADVLDYLASETTTQGILLYIESVTNSRKFMSAARAAARDRPVLVIKAGRFAEGARAATSHTGALAGVDEVFDAAIRRAGLLRVLEIDELFDAAETLARSRPIQGNRVAIITNGGGPGVLATDALIADGGRLAELSPEVLNQLHHCLPPAWSHGNPVDIVGDAGVDRYREAFRILSASPDIDAILVMHVPTAVVQPDEVAQALIKDIPQSTRPVLVSWLGEGAVANARQLFQAAGIPSYDTPTKAVRALLHLVQYRRNQELLMETPPSIPEQFTPATHAARWIIDAALNAGRTTLTEPEAKAVLSAYGLPVVETRTVTNEEDALAAARELGYPVALKLLSQAISHKSDVGGVALNIDDDHDLRARAKAMRKRVAALCPGAPIDGFTVQQMVRRPGAHELILGMTTDPLFGPVLLFGQGGTAVEIVADKAIALPPLTIHLARELMARTRISRLLHGYRDHPSADLSALEMSLIKVSQLVVDLPEIVELDINPLLADRQGVVALDARIRVSRTDLPGAARLAIRPYPKELEEIVFLSSGRKILLRPIRPEDEPAHQAFVGHLDPEDIYFRFFTAAYTFDHVRLARFTQIDYDREMAFIATALDEQGVAETLGVIRAISDVDNVTAEFAIVVRSDLKGQGLGKILMDKIVRYCRAHGTHRMVAEVLPQNTAMLELAKQAGFRAEYRLELGVTTLSLNLNTAQRVERG